MAHRHNPADGLHNEDSYYPSHARSARDQENTDDEDVSPSDLRTEPEEPLNLSHGSASLPSGDPHYVPGSINLDRIGSLTALSSDFVRIKFDDHRRCGDFVDAEPQVVDEDLDALQHEAQLAYGRGKDGLGDRCMQRWLIIRECRGLSSRKIRDYFARLATRRSTYQNLQRDFSKVTQRLKDNAGVYVQQYEATSRPANYNMDRTPRITAAVSPVYQAADQVSTPIQIPSRRTVTRERDQEHDDSSRYMSFDRGGVDSRQERSLSPSSYSHAEMNPTSWSHLSPGQPLAYRPKPTQRRSSISTTTTAHDPRSSLSRMLPPTNDDLPRNQQPAANEAFRGGANNPYRTTRMTPRAQTRAISQTPWEEYPSHPRALETSTQPEQPVSPPATELLESPPGNPAVVIRPQEATVEPSILPGTTLDIQGGQTETNNAGYIVRKDGKNFFRAGRVFKIIWHTPAGTNRQGQFNQSNNVMDGPWNSKIYTKPLWMLVVFRKHGYSICCPISTYDGNGLSRKNLPQQEIRAHAVIHSSNTKPKIFHDEPKMGKYPIPVDMAKGQPDLDKASRVHFGKFHTVEWNVFVMNVGTVKKGLEEEVRNNFLRELLGPNLQTP